MNKNLYQPLASGALSAVLPMAMGASKNVEYKKGITVALICLGVNKFVSPMVRRNLPVDANLDFLSVDLTESALVGGTYVLADKMGLISDKRGDMKEFLYVAGADYATRWYMNDYEVSPAPKN